MAEHLRSWVVNSDEFTNGEDRHFQRRHGAVNGMWLTLNDMDVQITGHAGWVVVHRLEKPPVVAGKLRKLTYLEAEDHPFILKLGDQENAVYYGVDPV